LLVRRIAWMGGKRLRRGRPECRVLRGEASDELFSAAKKQKSYADIDKQRRFLKNIIAFF